MSKNGCAECRINELVIAELREQIDEVTEIADENEREADELRESLESLQFKCDTQAAELRLAYIEIDKLRAKLLKSTRYAEGIWVEDTELEGK